MKRQAGAPRKRRLNLPPREAAEWIIERLRDAGHQALLAGGCVRDVLMGREPKDYDVATDARPEQLLRLFRRKRKVGVQFGVVIVGDAGPWIEVATFRSDLGYADGRHPEQVVFASAEQDALRRDFTVNGLFYDPVEKRVIDYVGGQADIDRRVIRAIGDPAERFAEDHLRMLRAVRFAATLDFRIEAETWAAIVRLAERTQRVSRERVLEELQRMLASPGRAVGMRLMAEAGLLPYAIPAAGEGEAWPAAKVELACRRLANLPETVSFECAMAAALADWPARRIDKVCREMTCSNEQRKGIVWLVRSLEPARRAEQISLADLKRLMAHESFKDLKRLLRAALAGQCQDLRPWQTLRRRAAEVPREAVQPEPFVTGEDLKALHVEPGPIYKKVLDAVYTAQLNEQVRSRDEALKLLREHLRRAVSGP